MEVRRNFDFFQDAVEDSTVIEEDAEFSIGESHLPAGIDQEQQDFRLGGDP